MQQRHHASIWPAATITRRITASSRLEGPPGRHRPAHADRRPARAAARRGSADETFMMTYGDGVADVDVTRAAALPPRARQAGDGHDRAAAGALRRDRLRRRPGQRVHREAAGRRGLDQRRLLRARTARMLDYIAGDETHLGARAARAAGRRRRADGVPARRASGSRWTRCATRHARGAVGGRARPLEGLGGLSSARSTRHSWRGARAGDRRDRHRRCWLVKRLLADGAYVVALVRDWDPQSESDPQRRRAAGRAVVSGRLEDYDTLERAINEHEIDTVFHLGAQTIVGTALRSPLVTFEANVRGTYNLLEAARVHGSLVRLTSCSTGAAAIAKCASRAPPTARGKRIWRSRRRTTQGRALSHRARWRLTRRGHRPTASFAAPIAATAGRARVDRVARGDDFGVRALALRVRPLNPPDGLGARRSGRHAARNARRRSARSGSRKRDRTRRASLCGHGSGSAHRRVRRARPGRRQRSAALHVAGERFSCSRWRKPRSKSAATSSPNAAPIGPRARSAAPHHSRRRHPARQPAHRNPRLRPPSRICARAPEGVRRAARLIDALTMAPEDGYFRDLAVYLGFALRALANSTRAATIEANRSRRRHALAHGAARRIWRRRRCAPRAGRSAAPAGRGAGATARRRSASANCSKRCAAPPRITCRRWCRKPCATANAQNHGRHRRSGADQRAGHRGAAAPGAAAERAGPQRRSAAIAADAGEHPRQSRRAAGPKPQGGGGEGERDSRCSRAWTSSPKRWANSARCATRRASSNNRTAKAAAAASSKAAKAATNWPSAKSQIRQGLGEAQRMADEAGAAPSEDLNAAGEAMRQAENALRRGDLEGAEAAQIGRARTIARRRGSAWRRKCASAAARAARKAKPAATAIRLGRPTRRGDGDGDTRVPATVRSGARARNLRRNPPPRAGSQPPRGRARISAPPARSLRRQLSLDLRRSRAPLFRARCE